MSDRISKTRLRDFLDEQIQGWERERSCFRDHSRLPKHAVCVCALSVHYANAFRTVRREFFPVSGFPEQGDDE